jgi:hypothetical protein
MSKVSDVSLVELSSLSLTHRVSLRHSAWNMAVYSMSRWTSSPKGGL